MIIGLYQFCKYHSIYSIDFENSCGMATTDRCSGIIPPDGTENSNSRYLMEVSNKWIADKWTFTIICIRQPIISYNPILLFIANQRNGHGCTLSMVLLWLLFWQLYLVDVWWDNPVLQGLFWATRGAIWWLLWARFLCLPFSLRMPNHCWSWKQRKLWCKYLIYFKLYVFFFTQYLLNSYSNVIFVF